MAMSMFGMKQEVNGSIMMTRMSNKVYRELIPMITRCKEIRIRHVINIPVLATGTAGGIRKRKMTISIMKDDDFTNKKERQEERMTNWKI